MPKTRAQFTQRIAEKLGAVEAGQSISGEDSVFIYDKIPAIAEALNADNIVYIGDIEAVDDEIFEDVSKMAADRFLPTDFGKQTDVNAVAAGEKTLRRITASRPSFAPLEIDYF